MVAKVGSKKSQAGETSWDFCFAGKNQIQLITNLHGISVLKKWYGSLQVAASASQK